MLRTAECGSECWSSNEGRSWVGNGNWNEEQSLCFGEKDKEYYETPNSKCWMMGEVKSAGNNNYRLSSDNW